MVTHDRNVDVSIKIPSYDRFTAEEVLQRFSREISPGPPKEAAWGCPLPKASARACGGSFKAEIDGDQFR